MPHVRTAFTGQLAYFPKVIYCTVVPPAALCVQLIRSFSTVHDSLLNLVKDVLVTWLAVVVWTELPLHVTLFPAVYFHIQTPSEMDLFA